MSSFYCSFQSHSAKMKATLLFLGILAGARAHYVFPALIYDGVTEGDWEQVRQWEGYQTNDPVTDVTSDDIRCNVNPAFAPEILTVTAGSTLGFTVAPDIYHPGPLLAYMAKVPSGYTAATWDGSGTDWFKIYQDEPTGLGTVSGLDWPSNGRNSLLFLDLAS